MNDGCERRMELLRLAQTHQQACHPEKVASATDKGSAVACSMFLALLVEIAGKQRATVLLYELARGAECSKSS
jgi:hypothetical protein